MKKMWIGLSICLAFGLAGCSKNDEKATSTSESKVEATSESTSMTDYEEAMITGKEAIVKNDMKEAKSAFKRALKDQKNDEEAILMMEQIDLYSDAMSLNDEKKYPEALEKLTELYESKGGSKTLKGYGIHLTRQVSAAVLDNLQVAKDKEAKEAKDSEVAQKESAEKEKATEEAKQAEAAAAENSGTGIWNAQKRAELATFMSQWGPRMGQAYLEYYPGFDADHYGISFPSTFAVNNIAVGGSPANVQWSADGSASDVYNVVAIYSDTASTTENKHLYLFSIYNGQPIVLVTMQNQGNPENLVYFDETQNGELKAGFAQIIGNE